MTYFCLDIFFRISRQLWFLSREASVTFFVLLITTSVLSSGANSQNSAQNGWRWNLTGLPEGPSSSSRTLYISPPLSPHARKVKRKIHFFFLQLYKCTWVRLPCVRYIHASTCLLSFSSRHCVGHVTASLLERSLNPGIGKRRRKRF